KLACVVLRVALDLMFLEAGKHVCVEYPMALSYQAAAQLWDLAQKKGVVLHEEHIELLTEDYKQLKKEVEGKTLLEGSLHFAGGALKPGFGFPAFSGIARLSWLVDLFGELSVRAATFEEDAKQGYSKMTAQLLTSDSKLDIIFFLTKLHYKCPLHGKNKLLLVGFSLLAKIPLAKECPVCLKATEKHLQH
uniref:Biliverdin reductase A-like n=1 Tax=Poecilia latipinna TaxID=48699 RepID=A0A3B3TNE6_9TELE